MTPADHPLLPETLPDAQVAAPRRPPPKTRSYSFDSRHLAPLARDLFSLLGAVVVKRDLSRVVSLGREVRQHAFDLRDPFPLIEHSELAQFVSPNPPRPILLPPIDVLSLSGLGFVNPYAMLATIASALDPAKIFEIGTFRGVASLTLAMNAPHAQVYTLDLPPDSDAADQTSLTRGDQEWVRLSRSSVGFAFEGRPEQARIHQLYGDSLSFTPPDVLKDSDLCFIDAGHSLECVRADTLTALSVVRPGGILVWDDYSWFIDGVRQFLGQIQLALPLHRIKGSHLVICRVKESDIARARQALDS